MIGKNKKSKGVVKEEKAKKDLITRDWLAVERTKLANERTFLAYFRTGVVFMATGVGMIKLTILEEIDFLGYVFMGLGPLIIAVGLFRLAQIRRVIRKYYK